MSTLYEKQGFEDGQILYAENLIKIEDGIQSVESDIARLDEQVSGFEERFQDAANDVKRYADELNDAMNTRVADIESTYETKDGAASKDDAVLAEVQVKFDELIEAINNVDLSAYYTKDEIDTMFGTKLEEIYTLLGDDTE